VGAVAMGGADGAANIPKPAVPGGVTLSAAPPV